ncbi:MAG: glycine zipper 2TM domain-containing protein [Arsenophonus sp. ET-KM2-MAG3]
MLKQIILSIFIIILSGCVNTADLSWDTYTTTQVKQVQSVIYGTITHVTPINIQTGGDENIIGALGGAILGGLFGNTVGGGKGNTFATAAGAIAGGLTGQNIQIAFNKKKGIKLEIKLNNNRIISVIQKGDLNSFYNGQRVSIIIGNGNKITVSPS